MVTKLQIHCVIKSERLIPHERIQWIGGVVDDRRWKLSESQAIAAIEAGTHQFHVVDSFRILRVVVATRNDRKYLKTTADDYAPAHLLPLPECG